MGGQAARLGVVGGPCTHSPPIAAKSCELPPPPHLRWQGEVLITAGDRPPGVGVHVYRSTDAGDSWQEVTGAVFGGECAGAKGGRTPVPFFAGGLALLGTATGHLLGAADGARREWRVLCGVPAQITCMAAPGQQSPSSVMH